MSLTQPRSASAPDSAAQSSAPPNVSRLIVNADDFGLHHAINQGIVQGHEQGVVTSCSLMPLYGEPAYDEAVQLALARPRLDVGLHFCLVGLPGQPESYKEFMMDYALGKYPDDRLFEMLNLQIEALRRSGITPSHIDSHQHLHALPRVMRVVAAVARERKILAVRLPVERDAPSDASLARKIAERSLSAAAHKAQPALDEFGVWYPGYFTGMTVSGNMTESRLLAMLDKLPLGVVSEIVCHPGVDNAKLRSAFPSWGYNWEAERAAVTSERVLYRMAMRSIELTTFAAAASGKTP